MARPGGADALAAERAHRDLPALAFFAEAARRPGCAASVKNTSLNISSPMMSRIVRHSMPGVSMSMMNAVMPSCLRFSSIASGSVRSRNRPHFARCAVEIQIFWPLTTYSSPSRIAIVRRFARSEPACGSEKPWHQCSVGREDAGQPLVLLLVGAPRDDHRADLPEPVRVVDARRAVLRHRLGVDDVLHRRGFAAAPLLRPVDAAQRPSFSRRCQSRAPILRALDAGRLRAAGIVVAAPVGEELRRGSRRASPTSSSRNASSSAVYAKSIEPDNSVRYPDADLRA